MDERTIDRHSVNCLHCAKLVDERECVPGPANEGNICPTCQDDLDFCKTSPDKKHHVDVENSDFGDECEVCCKHCGRTATVEIYW